MLIVCDKYTFVYCQIPKSACSAIKKWILQLQGNPHMGKLSGSRLLRYIHSYKFKTITPREYLDNPKYNSYTLFTVVRNPYLRVVSAFKDRFIQAYKNEPALIWKQVAKNITGTQYLTFRQFLKYIQPTAQDIHRGNHHWHLQTALISNNLLNYDIILHMETLKSDIVKLCDKLGIPKQFCSLSILNSTGNTVHQNKYVCDISTNHLNFKTHWKWFYLPNLQQIVYQKYRADFVAFGYSSKLPIC